MNHANAQQDPFNHHCEYSHLMQLAPSSQKSALNMQSINQKAFAACKNDPAITMRQIVGEEHPILLVLHDDEGGGWQFFTGKPFKMADILLSSLEEVISIDPSILALADLPRGWEASRNAPGQPWIRSKTIHTTKSASQSYKNNKTTIDG